MLSMLLISACALADDPAPTTAPVPSSSPAIQLGSRRDVTVAHLASRLAAESSVVVLDVRTVGEFEAGHVPGAVNIPVGELEARMAELDAHKGEEIWTICAVGGRSAAASDVLAQAGHIAVNVDGGTNGWIAAGHEIEK